jgi:hypothetical protein
VTAKLNLADNRPRHPPSPEFLAFVDALADLAADRYLAGYVPKDPGAFGRQSKYGHEHEQEERPSDE